MRRRACRRYPRLTVQLATVCAVVLLGACALLSVCTEERSAEHGISHTIDSLAQRAHACWYVGNRIGAREALDSLRGISPEHEALDGRYDYLLGERIDSLDARYGVSEAAAVSPDWEYLVIRTGSSTALVRLAGMEEQYTISHGWNVTALAFCPSGSTFVSTTGFASYMWRLKDGKQLRFFNDYTGGITDVAVTPDGGHIITNGPRNTAARHRRSGESRTGLSCARTGTVQRPPASPFRRKRTTCSPEIGAEYSGSGEFPMECWYASSRRKARRSIHL